MVKVSIKRVLCSHGYKPYYLQAYPIIVKKDGEYFQTLSDLKEYYNISKMKKAGSSWAVSSTGKTHRWIEYEAEISEEFIIKIKK